MATVTGSYSFESEGKTYIETFRITYSLNDTYPDRAVATVTKVEAKRNYAASSSTSHEFYMEYYDSILVRQYAATFFTSTFKWTTSYQTIFSGSKSITSYKLKGSPSTIELCSCCNISVSARTTYTVTYLDNQGSGGPGTNIKYYGYNLYISTIKPTRTGYTFLNWKSSYDNKYYSGGAIYAENAATTMTAQWSANDYYITYNANGGTGSISRQIKTYDEEAYFNNANGLRKVEVVNGITIEYEALRWNTNPDGTGTAYIFGSAIPNISSNLAVYAIWQEKYLYPKINNLQDYRTETSSPSDHDRYDNGEYIYIGFDFIGCSSDNGTTYIVPNCIIRIDDDFYYSYEHDGIGSDFNMSFTSGNIGSLSFKPSVIYDCDTPHTITVMLFDPTYENSQYRVTDYITTSVFPIDLYDHPTRNEVYMGVMHPYSPGQLLTIQDLYTDGKSVIRLDVDEHASASTDAISGEDKELFNAVRRSGHMVDCVTTSNGLTYLDSKKLITKLYNSEFAPFSNYISEGSDLNTYTTYGRYFAKDLSAVQTIANRPVNTLFCLDVDNMSLPGNIRQTVTVLSSSGVETYTRLMNYAGTWFPWQSLKSYIVGEIRLMAHIIREPGWSECDGKTLSRTTYEQLFNVIGTTYGSGDGSNTFNIPDLRGRVPIGSTMSSATSPALTDNITTKTIGDKAGNADMIIPYHRHTRGGNWYSSSGSSTGSAFKTTSSQKYTTTAYTGYAEGSTSGNRTGANMPPYLTMIYYIYTGVINV